MLCSACFPIPRRQREPRNRESPCFRNRCRINAAPNVIQPATSCCSSGPRPSPNPELAGKKPTRSQLEEALRLLNRATRLGLPLTRSYHLRRAEYLRLLADVAAAGREQELATTARSEDALDYFLTGVTRQKQGHLQEAARDFTDALVAQPDHFWARYFLAVCELQLQRPAPARDHLTACMMSRPGFSWLYLLRGFAHGQLNEFQAANADYQRALARKHDAQAYYGILVNQGELCVRQARLADGLPPVPWLLPLTPNLDVAFRGVAEVYRAERLDAAAGYLRKAIGLEPEQYPAYRYLAASPTSSRSGWTMQPSRSGRLSTRPEAGNPSCCPCFTASARGANRQSGHDLDAALQDLNEALRLAPRAEDHAERGRLLHARHKHVEAVASFDAALRLRPGEAEIALLKAEALLALHRATKAATAPEIKEAKQLEIDAAAALDQYLANGGKPTAEIYRTRGQIRARLREFPAALADYTQALARQPDAPTYVARGWILLANEVAPLALQDFETALRLDAKNAEAYAGRGLILVRRGKADQAIADVEAALRHGPATPRLLWNTAHVYAQLVSQVDTDSGVKNDRVRSLRARYLFRALEMLGSALEMVPRAEQAAFWRQYVAPDSLLDPLRDRPRLRTIGTKI